MTTTHSRRARRLRDYAVTLSPQSRDLLRERSLALGVECVARFLGVDDRALLSAIAAVPARSLPRVMAALAERGLP